MKRAIVAAFVCLFLAALVPQTSRAQGESYALDDGYYFAETGHSVQHGFWDYYRTNGRINLLGYPITDEFEENGLAVQYFQRARLEWHTDVPGGGQVLLGLVGSEATADRMAEAPFAPIAPFDSSRERRFFSETGHSLNFGFLQYWLKHDGLERFGLPISEEFAEVSPTDGQTYTVQYLQRARFEYHPELPEGSRVLLALLGQEIANRKGWTSDQFPLAPAAPPAPAGAPRANPWGPEMALTFDDGFPNAQALYEVLATLRTYDVKCTFFVLGSWVEGHPDLANLIVSEGHEIANHTFSHRDESKLSDDEIRSELSRTDWAIISATGVSSKPLFRFPYGSKNQRALDVVASEGYLTVGWNIDPNDWKGISAGEVAARVTSHAFDKGIVVLHPGLGTSHTADALGAIITSLRGRGFALETVSQMWNLP
jgi:peptidoglycan/xylan/chitin deacetylase (PgdA/CDA1 family)